MWVVAAMAAVQMYQGMQQADATRRQNRMNRNIARMNAESAELDAWKAMKQGYSQVARYSAVEKNVIGQQKAVIAAAGGNVNDPTAMAIQQESRLTTYLNTLDLMNQARGKAKQYEVEAANIKLQSQMGTIQANMTADAQATAGVMNAMSTGITGYANAGYPGMNKTTDSGVNMNDPNLSNEFSLKTRGFSPSSIY